MTIWEWVAVCVVFFIVYSVAYSRGFRRSREILGLCEELEYRKHKPDASFSTIVGRCNLKGGHTGAHVFDPLVVDRDKYG